MNIIDKYRSILLPDIKPILNAEIAIKKLTKKRKIPYQDISIPKFEYTLEISLPKTCVITDTTGCGVDEYLWLIILSRTESSFSANKEFLAIKKVKKL
jgi:hypothetical protein